MKRLVALPIFTVLLVFALPALASEDTVVTLNDATPSIDVVITLPPDTTGAIGINMSMAAITLKDQAGNVVFHAADNRLHALELNIAPNTGQHTLTVERLPGVAAAYVSITGMGGLTMNGESIQVADSPIQFNQSELLSLDVSSPGGTADISIPADQTGVVTATMFGANATTQLVDGNGVVVAESFGGHVDGITMLIDGGEYSMNILGSGLEQRVVSEVRVIPTDEAGFIVMDAPQAPEMDNASTSNAPACTATIMVSSVNLRSGPGTGYSVLQYGYNSETYPVGGRNSDGSWIVIGTNGGSAWIASNTSQLEGSCNELAVYDIPYREAQEPQIIITAPQQANVAPAASANNTSSYHDDHDEGEYEHEDD